MTIWQDFGFRENPYTTSPISPDEEGARLLVGRDKELSQLLTYLTSTSTHPTIEGANGVGKTSLVAVAGFKQLQSFLDGNARELIIPMRGAFQLTSGSTVGEFKRRVYLEVAQRFIDYREALLTAGLDAPDVSAVQSWLNRTGGVTGGVGVTTPMVGAQFSYAQSNSSSGFDEAGFLSTVERWLRECFRSKSAGAFLCLIDNLEILETSSEARKLLEALRDELFNVQGLRWVLLGARGIVRSVASSPRLQGVLADPIELDPIADDMVAEVVNRRLSEYRLAPDAYAPVEPRGFRHLYDVVNRSLRDTLKYCEDFAIWLQSQPKRPQTGTEKYAYLEVWMAELADKYSKATSGVGPRAWEVFDGIVKSGGNISPSQFAEFGFNSSQVMRPHVKALEDAQLVDSAVDETDQRRRTITITARGWIVQYQRSGFKLTSRG